MMHKQAMKVPVLLVIVGVTFMLCGQVSTSCSCSGYVTSKGRGECNTSYKGKKYCYVNPGQCSDQIKGSSSNRFWSYQACEKSSSPLPQVRKTQLLRALAEPAAQRTTPVGRVRVTVTQTTGTPVSQVSGQYYNVNKDGFINCQTREDCPPNFETSNYDSFFYWCGEVDMRCHENSKGGITCGNGKRAKDCGDCGTTEEECGGGDCFIEFVVYNNGTSLPLNCIEKGVTCGNGKPAKDCGDCEECGIDCLIEYVFNNNGTSLPLTTEEECGFSIVDFKSGAFPLTWSSAIGGTGISSATNPDRYDECGPRYCRRRNKCCLLVNIGRSNRYLGCPSYC